MKPPPTLTGGDPHPTRLQIVVLSASVFMAVTTELMPAGLLPWLSRDLGVSNDRAGLLVTAYAFVVATTALPLTAATIRWPRRKLITAVLLGYALSNVLMAVAGSLLVAGVARLVGGLSHAILFSIVTAYAARIVRPERLGGTVAVLWLGTALALLVGVPTGTALAASTGWRQPFVVLAVLATVLAGSASILLAPIETREVERVPVRSVVRTPGVALVAVATGLVMLGNFMVYTYVGPLLQSAGFTERQIGPALLVHGAAGVAGLWFSARTADHHPRLGLVIALSLLVCSVLVFGVVGDSKAAALVALAGWGGAYGGLATFFNAAALRASRAHDTATALINMAFNIGIGGGALLGALVLGAGGRPPVHGLLAAGLVGAGLALVLGGKRNGFPSGPRSQGEPGAG